MIDCLKAMVDSTLLLIEWIFRYNQSFGASRSLSTVARRAVKVPPKHTKSSHVRNFAVIYVQN